MKKILFLTIIAFLIFVGLSKIAFATSGACSSHGGVNCSLGASYDGSVSCNDYSSDSAVRYWDTVECNGSISQILKNCPAIGDLETQILNLVNQFQDLQTKEAQAIANEENRLAPMEIIYARIAKIQRDYGTQLSSVYRDIQTKCQTASMQQMENSITEQQNLMNQQYSCPANAYLVGNSCFCNDGYTADGSVCITYTQSCQKKYGINSYGDKNYCYCNTGYEFNSSKTACVLSIVCPLYSSKVGNLCVCNNGYIMKDNKCITYTEDCANSFGQNVYGIKGQDNNSSCFCNIGYEWNSTKTACEKSIICPTNSTKVNNQCICNAGYLMKNNACVAYTEDCIQQYGSNVYGMAGENNNSTCHCIAGYEWNSSKTTCIKVETKSSNNASSNQEENKTPMIAENQQPQSKQQSKGFFKSAFIFLANISSAISNFFGRWFK